MQISRAGQARSELQKVLVSAQAADGGWPYYRDRASRIEPTSWALLAMAALAATDHQPTIERGRAFLRGLRQDRGLLVEPGVPVPNLAWSALALLADISLEPGRGDAWRQRLVDGILAVRGIALEDGGSPVRQNNRLQAWSWIEGTFSWIEPTAFCLLALKKMSASSTLARTRIADAEAVILDRVCDGGGWNYGNAQVLGQDLRPYVPTTALALMAMQDRLSHPAVVSSLGWLKAHAGSEPSAMALSLSSISLTTVGERADVPREALLQQLSRVALLGNLHLTAMALCALSAGERAIRPFKVL